LIANVLYAGGGGPPTTATITPADDTYSGYAPPETAFRSASNANETASAANQSKPIIYAVPAEESNTLLPAANVYMADNAGVYYDADAVPGEATVLTNNGVY